MHCGGLWPFLENHMLIFCICSEKIGQILLALERQVNTAEAKLSSASSEARYALQVILDSSWSLNGHSVLIMPLKGQVLQGPTGVHRSLSVLRSQVAASWCSLTSHTRLRFGGLRTSGWSGDQRCKLFYSLLHFCRRMSHRSVIA